MSNGMSIIFVGWYYCMKKKYSVIICWKINSILLKRCGLEIYLLKGMARSIMKGIKGIKEIEEILILIYQSLWKYDLLMITIGRTTIIIITILTINNPPLFYPYPSQLHYSFSHPQTKFTYCHSYYLMVFYFPILNTHKSINLWQILTLIITRIMNKKFYLILLLIEM